MPKFIARKGNDVMEVEINDETGAIKVTTPGSISGPNHRTAEDIFQFIARKAGGETTRTGLGTKDPHHHHGQTTHQHQ